MDAVGGPANLLRDQQLGRDLKGLVAAHRYVREPSQRCFRIALIGFEDELDAETREGAAAPGSTE